MRREVYLSVLSKLSTATPLFAKAALEIAMRKRGKTVESLSAADMLQILEDDIDPLLRSAGKNFRSILLAGASQFVTNEKDQIIDMNSAARRLVSLYTGSEDATQSRQFESLMRAGFVRRVSDISALETRDFKDPKTGRYFNVSHSPLRDSKGKVTGVCSVVQDLSLKEELGSEIKMEVRQRIHAEQMILEQQEKLISSDRLSTLGEMASGVAHEINNPLAALMLKVQLMKRKLSRPKFELEETKRMLDEVEFTAHRIGQIVNGLLSVARDATADPFVRTNLFEVIKNTIGICGERFTANRVALRVNTPGPDIYLEARATELMQVLLNLLSNAFDAVETVPTKWVAVDAVDLGECVQVSVTDSGPGVPERIASRMMEPFFTTKRPSKGTGLGLSISLRIVTSHQGRLFLDRSSKNTRFSVVLPKRH